MTPRPVANREQDWLAAVTTEGRSAHIKNA